MRRISPHAAGVDEQSVRDARSSSSEGMPASGNATHAGTPRDPKCQGLNSRSVGFLLLDNLSNRGVAALGSSDGRKGNIPFFH